MTMSGLLRLPAGRDRVASSWHRRGFTLTQGEQATLQRKPASSIRGDAAHADLADPPRTSTGTSMFPWLPARERRRPLGRWSRTRRMRLERTASARSLLGVPRHDPTSAAVEIDSRRDRDSHRPSACPVLDRRYPSQSDAGKPEKAACRGAPKVELGARDPKQQPPDAHSVTQPYESRGLEGRTWATRNGEGPGGPIQATASSL